MHKFFAASEQMPVNLQPVNTLKNLNALWLLKNVNFLRSGNQFPILTEDLEPLKQLTHHILSIIGHIDGIEAIIEEIGAKQISLFFTTRVYGNTMSVNKNNNPNNEVVLFKNLKYYMWS